MDKVEQLIVLAKNQPGILANICGALGDEKINIKGISVIDHVDHCIVRMVVDQPHKASHLLGEAGLPVMEDAAIGIPLRRGPGSLGIVAEVLAEAGLNISYAYASEGADTGNTLLILKTNDDEAALRALRSHKKNNGANPL